MEQTLIIYTKNYIKYKNLLKINKKNSARIFLESIRWTIQISNRQKRTRKKKL